MLAHAYYPRTQETEARGSRVPGQPRLHIETFFQTNRKGGKRRSRCLDCESLEQPGVSLLTHWKI